MSRIVRSTRSLRDATDIWSYIAKDDVAAADRQIGRIDEKLSFLAETPRAGTPRPEMGRDVRSVAVGRYLVVYRPVTDGIRIVRILNAARDMRRVFRR